MFIDDQHFARFDFADKLSVDQIERACFRREHVCAIDFPEGEGTPAKRIAHRDEFAFAHDQERKRTLNATQRRQHISTIVRRLR